jgi:hypothetical protein
VLSPVSLESLTRLVADCERHDKSITNDETDLIFRLSVQLKNLQVEVLGLHEQLEELRRQHPWTGR